MKKVATIPWDDIEERYAALFHSTTGMPAKILQTALGALLIQKEYAYSDRELVEQIRENPYYQYFIGLPGYQDEAPFAPSALVDFRKRLTDEVLVEINEMIFKYNTPDDPPSAGNDSDSDTSSGGSTSPDRDIPSDSDENHGTLILDATCVPQQIAFP